MITIDPKQISLTDLQNYLQTAIAPRPICFASTIDATGNVNLSPFSFFNMMSTNPPICVFSPSRRVRDNTIKHTLENLREVPEVVINVVNYDMVQQVSLSSTDYPKGTNEFVKAGFTPVPSEMVKPPRVAESPVQFECVVNDIITLGEKAGSGNLVIAEIKRIHINEKVLDENGKIDQLLMDHVARLGGDWYARITPDILFKVAKPLQKLGIGIDALPASVQNSKVLTGNDLGKLGNVEFLPGDEAIEDMKHRSPIKEILDATIGDRTTRELDLHKLAKRLLDIEQVEEAWKVLLIS